MGMTIGAVPIRGSAHRLMAGIVGAIVLAACGARPSTPPATAALPTLPPETGELATFTVTGSGEFCGPWWFGCGAALVVEAPGWTMPADWSPRPNDTLFDVDPMPDGADGPARVTGVREPGPNRIAPGDYRLVVIETQSGDTVPARTTSRVKCTADMHIPAGTRAVVVDVVFGPGCTIAVRTDPEASPSS